MHDQIVSNRVAIRSRHFGFERERRSKNTSPLACNAFEEWTTTEGWKRSSTISNEKHYINEEN